MKGGVSLSIKTDKPAGLEGGELEPEYLWILLPLIELELTPVTIVLCCEAPPLDAVHKPHQGWHPPQKQNTMQTQGFIEGSHTVAHTHPNSRKTH